MELVQETLDLPEDRYARIVRSEYCRLASQREASGISGGLEEVKLRLFLSLLDKPSVSLLRDLEHKPRCASVGNG